MAAWMAATKHQNGLREYTRLEYSPSDAPWIEGGEPDKYGRPREPGAPDLRRRFAGSTEARA